MKRAIVLLNRSARSAEGVSCESLARQIAGAFSAESVVATVQCVAPEKLAEAARWAAGGHADLVVAGGGDGTLNAVGAMLVNSKMPLGILPLGTLNQLARELEIPADWREAVRTIAAGSARPINVGMVNGQVFLSFSAIGLYAETIRHRDAQRRSRGRNKWPAMVVSAVKMLRRFPLYSVQIEIDSRHLSRLTPLVFVALNEHQRQLLGLTEIGCAGREALSVYISRERNRWSAVTQIAGMLLRREAALRDVDVICAASFEVHTRRRHVRVAADGEVVTLDSPLRYRLLKSALHVVTANGSEATPGGRVGD